MAYSLKGAYDLISGIQASAEDLAGIKGYEHDQSVANATWTVTHNLNSYNLDVNCFDASENLIHPDNIQMTSANQVVITWSGTAVAGTARIQAKL